MTILVTGAAGQLGRECVERGAARVVGCDRSTLDITNAEALIATLDRLQPKAVINAAAYTAVDKAEQDAATAFAINRDAVASLASACAKRHIPLLHVSTDYVFDGSKSKPYVESDKVNPLGVYGASKQQGEAAVRQEQPQHLILRTSWVFGRYGANFVKTMLRLARERPELRVVADQRGAPTDAGALADVLIALAQRAANGETLPWGTYHYCGAPDTTWHGFAQTIVERAVVLGLLQRPVPVHPISTRDFPTPARRPANSRLDCDHIREKLAVEIRPWQDGLDDVLKHLMTSRT